MDKPIKKFTFLRQRRLIQRLDVFPFIIIHSLALIIYTNQNLNKFIRGISFGIVCTLQGIAFFCKFWNENAMAKICYKEAKSIKDATDVKVDVISEKFKMNNRTSICPLMKKEGIYSIEFEKLILIYESESKTFIKPKIEIKTKKVKEFLDVESLTTEEIKARSSKFGENRMNIPIPSFFALYKEHMVAPFFVFQLFCILLWVFDDYGIHSLISLIMLCVFEATVVGQQIFNLTTLRKMRVSPHFVFAYRNGIWTKVSSSELLPGDIVSVTAGSRMREIKEVEDEEQSGNSILQFVKRLKKIQKQAEEKRNQRMIEYNKRFGKKVDEKEKEKELEEKNKYKEKEPMALTCDLLLLSGSAIINESMLTGESVPQIKDSIIKIDYEHENYLDIKLRHKNSVLFSGTTVVKASRNDEMEQLPKNVHMPPPDKGCVCMVLKTGFSTSQGKLLRTVMYSSDRNKGDSSEAFVFIGVLLIIALYASYIVLIDGLKREGELTYKLFLRIVIIITSVVPAELPIELSLAINNSLSFLQSKKIVCIEPFRIPFAGKIDICCFDKTGTLTKDDFIMKGLVTPKISKPLNVNNCSDEALSVLLGCNSLITINNKPVGDPIEVAMFNEAKGTLVGEDMICERNVKISPIRKYQFDSALKRMTVICKYYEDKNINNPKTRVLCKGAPETIKTLLGKVPDDYDLCFNKWAKEGYRILAMAYLDNEKFNYNTKREELEKDLIFCGFALVETPLKPKIGKYIEELIKAKYDVCIITGDHFLTTSKVSKDLNLGPENFAFLKVERNKLLWYDLDNELIKETPDVEGIKKLSKKYTLGLTGSEMSLLEEMKEIKDKHLAYQYIRLFCRVSPGQKDDIIKHLIKGGKNPSMCGDGSNDVGALKRAMIGIALLNVEETKEQKEQPFNILSFEDDSQIKSGDATAAAPFTSKSGSIKCVKNIFIQGRCTLVVTFQMYKILALNCLMTAYSLSALALKGVKYSDYQSTYMGIIVSIYFLMLSRAKPLKNLNENHPPNTIFTKPAIISILGQAVVNLGSMLAIIKYTEAMDKEAMGKVKSLDDPFEPNLMNTIMFIFSMINQTITFVANYGGEPFMENVSKNPMLYKVLVGLAIATVIIVFEWYPPLNETLEIVPLPEDMTYRVSLLLIMGVNFIICYLLDNWPKLCGYYKL
ncbi:MAG: hypothetical protein MJ252_00225 [archaeon]|nr:hypothetical protein [archaeon]